MVCPGSAVAPTSLRRAAVKTRARRCALTLERGSRTEAGEAARGVGESLRTTSPPLTYVRNVSSSRRIGRSNTHIQSHHKSHHFRSVIGGVIPFLFRFAGPDVPI